jgi:hypothetical protein
VTPGLLPFTSRVFLADHLGSCSPEQADDIRVCLSELATNAIEHGTPHVRTPADTEPHGRGLFLVVALADDWGVSERIGPGKVVWAEFEIRQEAEVAW